MKNIVCLLLAMICYFGAMAQSTNTRNDANGDYSCNVIGFKSVSVADTAGSTVDTVDIRPAKAVSYYKFTTLDSACLRLKSTAACYKGDIIKLDVINSGPTAFFYLGGNFIVSTGTNKITNTTSRRTHMEFYFDGKNFLETSRLLNYTY